MAVDFKRRVLTLAVFLIPFFLFAAAETKIASPNGLIEFSVLSSNRLSYAVTFKSKPVIETSPFHFSLNRTLLTDDVSVDEIKTYRLNETYPWLGAHSFATNQCNGATLALQKGHTVFTLEVRVFNDGVAYRFIAPDANKRRTPDELSQFIIPAGSRVWHHDLGGHYEGVHTESDVEAIPAGEWIAPPMTIKLPGGLGYAAITEAGLFHYSGLALEASGRRAFTIGLAHRHPISYQFDRRHIKESAERLSKPAAMSGAITTPWRVVMIGADLNTLVTSDIIHNLCPPPDSKLFPKGNKTAWIKPGRAVWRYLDGGSNTIEGTKEFCRLAGELGFEYSVVEGHWSRWNEQEIRDVVSYAKNHGVGLLVWKHSGGLRDADERNTFFRQLRDLGIAGVKTDFFDHEHKEVVDLYGVILEDAAKHQLLVLFHGCNKPTGTSRTWPNEITREAVRGMAASRTSERATHEATLPFTRYLAGPADYSVVFFGDRRRDTTWAHQIATAAVFSQPLLTYAAHPEKLLASPAADLIKTIPPVWDETRVLSMSEIGKIAVYARRAGNVWFLAVVNGAEEQSITVPLTFLGPPEYQALLVRDSGSGPDSVRTETRLAHRTDSLMINLRAGGGFLGRFTVK